MKQIDEDMFVVALTERDEDAKNLAKLFDPKWLKNKELVPVLEAIYEFRRKHGLTPTIGALHEYLSEQDADMYNARWKATLGGLEQHPKDQSRMILAINKAKDIGSALALEALITSQDFQTDLINGEGDALLKRLRGHVSQWTEQHAGEGVMNIKKAFEKLINDSAWRGRPDRIGSGIMPLDLWTNGGLRPRQLGIIMAPTGGGKSAVLLNIAHSVATVEQLPVLLLTNELTLNEQSERMLARMQKPVVLPDGTLQYKTLQEIQDDPSVAYSGLERRWAAGLEKRLLLVSKDLGVTADDIEDEVKRLRLEEGFMPAVIVIDYMERMAPMTKVNREKEWIYIGEIAKELVRLAKRLDVLVWTAVQTNRGGLNKKAVLDMTHGQGSIRQFQEAAFVGSVQKVIVPLAQNGEQKIHCLAFAEQKQRHNAFEERIMMVRHDLSRMYISKDEVEMPDDTEAEVEADDSTGKPKILSPWKSKTIP